MSDTLRTNNESTEPSKRVATRCIPLPEPRRVTVVNALLADRSRFTAFFSARIGDQFVAQDLFQDLCIRAIERSEALQRGELVTGWLFRIARSVLVDYIRSNTSRARREIAYASELEILEGSIVTEEFDTEPCLCAVDMLGDLADLDRQILQKVDMYGQPREAILGELGISRANLRVRLHRSRKTLREALGRVCGKCVESTQFNQCSC